MQAVPVAECRQDSGGPDPDPGCCRGGIYGVLGGGGGQSCVTGVGTENGEQKRMGVIC